MHDLVVVGAGPYGLSIAAHAAAAGFDLRLLGRAMASWRDHMPAGMFLKSEPWASDLSDPQGTGTLAAYAAAHGLRAEHGRPLPLATFADYGLWFAGRLPVPVEDRTVTTVAPHAGGYRVETADGAVLLTRCVAMAAGVLPLIRLPEPLRELPPGLASHSSDHRDLRRFRGRHVTVIGAGQAALETAALLAEAGARPLVLARAPRLRWNTPPLPLHRGPMATLRTPHSALGPGWSSWTWSRLPNAVRRLPARTRARIVENALGPAGAWWLRDRLEGVVPVRLGHRLVRAVAADGGVRLELAVDPAGGAGSGGGEPAVVETEHVLAATGFVTDLRRLEILDPSLRHAVRKVRGTTAPELTAGFESSRPGLFFAGLLTAPSFGPSMRFVHGATFTAGRLVRGVGRRLGGGRGAAQVPRPAASARGAAGWATGAAAGRPE
ncbi:NAD(P)-binding domain-containing protein [Streptomyces hoynatensis]|uniref:Dimethylaniline monooxygenase n=1 Tax=Streptomyces hoynatensis TaxID=1141874 RepID=A0A3A9Z7H9_9ACTN|nr:NAD(P)-binding domain-containing protein [Streptomyces hoynatensis]RKN43176.1 dimethylaniline monooxygenase [Streptomyces hoynatensis]